MEWKERRYLPIAVVTADAKNDLFGALASLYCGIVRYSTLSEALDAAEESDICGIMLLADGYPEAKTEPSREEAERLRARGLRLYIEYPEENARLGIVGYDGEATMGYSRAIVRNADAIHLDVNSILYVHGARYRKKTDDGVALMVAATVAGYDTAAFPLDDCECHTLLEVGGTGRVLIAATKLSGFISARYAPYARWCAVFEAILSFLCGERVTGFAYTPAVVPSFAPDAPLPADACRLAVQKNCEWYLSSGIL